MEEIKNFQVVMLISVIVAVVVLIAAIICVAVLISKVKTLKKDYDYFMRDADGNDLSATLKACLNQIDYLINKDQIYDNEIKKIYKRFIPCAQKIGMIRFNAFDNVGSNQSYSIAILDEKNDGFVLSGIYARESSTTYMKPIEQGKSNYPLSDEEEKAVYKAITVFEK